jgi:hypothetical protein
MPATALDRVNQTVFTRLGLEGKQRATSSSEFRYSTPAASVREEGHARLWPVIPREFNLGATDFRNQLVR